MLAVSLFLGNAHVVHAGATLKEYIVTEAQNQIDPAEGKLKLSLQVLLSRSCCFRPLGSSMLVGEKKPKKHKLCI